MKRWAVGFAVLAALLVGGQSQGDIIHESATLGSVGYTGTGSLQLGTDQFLGSRFTLTDPVQVDSIGGHIADHNRNSGSLFGSIVSLTGPTALPSGSSTTLATTSFNANFPSTDFLTPLSVALPPGDYALIFGANGDWRTHPKTSGLGCMPINNTDIAGQASYFFGDGFGAIFHWRDGSFSGTRFVVTGTVIPEPSTLVLLSMGALALLTYAWRRRRWR